MKKGSKGGVEKGLGAPSLVQATQAHWMPACRAEAYWQRWPAFSRSGTSLNAPYQPFLGMRPLAPQRPRSPPRRIQAAPPKLRGFAADLSRSAGPALAEGALGPAGQSSRPTSQPRARDATSYQVSQHLELRVQGEGCRILKA